MAIGKNKLGDQIIPKSEQQKHKHSKDAQKKSSPKNDKPVREEEKQAVGYQDSGATRASQTPD